MATNNRTVSDAADFIMEEISPIYKTDKIISVHCSESVELFVAIGDCYREVIITLIEMDSYEGARVTIESLLKEMFDAADRAWYTESSDKLWEEYIVPVFDQLRG